MNQWIGDLLGKPWVRGANGPDAFDCLGLVKFVYKERKGIELPSYGEVNFAKKKEVAKAITHNFSNHWIEVRKPLKLCAVGLSSSRKFIHHIGIFLPDDSGLVLHSHEASGVVVQNLLELRVNGWTNIKYYDYSN